MVVCICDLVGVWIQWLLLPLLCDLAFFDVSVCDRVDKIVDIRHIFFYWKCLNRCLIVEIMRGCEKKKEKEKKLHIYIHTHTQSHAQLQNIHTQCRLNTYLMHLHILRIFSLK